MDYVQLEEGSRPFEAPRLNLRDGVITVCVYFFGSALVTPYGLVFGGWASMLIYFAMFLLALITAFLVVELTWSHPSSAMTRSTLSFIDLAPGPMWQIYTQIILYSELFMYLMYNVNAAGANLHHIWPSISEKTLRVFMGLLLVGPCCLPTPKDFAHISKLAVPALVFITMLLGVVWADPELADGEGARDVEGRWPLASLPYFMLALSAHIILPPICTDLADQSKRKARMVAGGGLAVGTATVMLFCALCYYLFGRALRVNVTLNMRPGTCVAYIAMVCRTLHVYAVCPLFVMPLASPVETAHSSIGKSHLTANQFRILLRTTILLVTVAASFVVDQMEDVAEAIGAFAAPNVVLVLPCAFYALSERGQSSSWLVRAACWAGVALGFVVVFLSLQSAGIRPK